MEYPHIKDDSFPHVNNVDVWKFQNDFDYARWQGKISIKLLNVKWNSEYNDVPGFNTDDERDLWFDGQRGVTKTLESAFNITPQNTVKIPIPYNDAYTYNYLVVDMPMQTSENQPIDYEESNTRVSRWYYFINSMTQYAPNTTELNVTLDAWTTFLHTVEIPYLMLERGHAPMMQTNVATYLANPILNNEYLLADDFNYGNETIIQTSTYKPIGNGTKYVLFCAPYKQSDFASFGGTAYSGSSTPPTYENTQDRWGYQFKVNGYEWKYGDSDYSSADLPISNEISEGILNGCNCYAIEGTQAQAFFNDCSKYCAHFIHGIQAMFILDESMFTKGTGFSFRNKTIYPVTKKHNSETFAFTKNHFGFDSKYADITKLYTSPYSFLEVCDNEGNTFSAKIENCGSVKLHSEVSIVYPYLNYNVFLSGINGDGEATYTWKTVDGTSETKTIWASDFAKFMLNWQIPTYSIYVSAQDEYAANNYAGNEAKRSAALRDYHNALRLANTIYENTDDSYQTNTDNVAAIGTMNWNNTKRSTSTDVTNTQKIQKGLMDNMDDTNDTNDLITDTYMNGGINGGNLPVSPQNGFIPKTTWANWEKLADDADTDWEYIHDAFNANAEYFCSSAVVNGAASILGGGSSTGGSIAGASEKTSAASIGIPVIGGIASGIATTVSIPLTITKDSTLTNLQQNVIEDKTTHAHTNINKCFSAQTEYNHNVKEANNDLRESITTRFSDTSVNNGIYNANADRTKTTVDKNAEDLKDTNNSNAVRTQTTETNNAEYIRNANVDNEKDNLTQKQLEVANTYKNAKLQAPYQRGEYNGNFNQDVYERRGIRFNIRTQSKAAISQAGDAFLRFGYALHRVWDMSNGFHYGKHFTFWKAEDVWINDGSGLAGNSVNIIRDILMSGTTVWRNPDEIGTLSIYDNI